jgi:hypothetical protein
MSCPPLELVAEWCLGELPAAAAERFEEHYFGCDRCFEQATRMQAAVEQLRASLPPVLTPERRRALERREPRLSTTRVAAGERALLHLSQQQPLGIWLMQAPLAEVTRVDFEARDTDGELLFALSDVPFDASRGEVVLACQLHYRALPMSTQLHVRLTATSPNGSQELGRYILDHQFDSL